MLSEQEWVRLGKRGSKELIRKTDLDLWEWVLAQTYKIRNKISQEIER